MKYEDWMETLPQEITGDPIWRLEVYRLALYLADLGWDDICELRADERFISLSDQLYRAIGSISANIAEGYSRSTGPDRARFFEYALGSARESRDWYYKCRFGLGNDKVLDRIGFLTQIIRLLLSIIPHQRSRGLRDKAEMYILESSDKESDI
jgi:four helix bundle protein